MKHDPQQMTISELVNRIDADGDNFDIFDALETGSQKPPGNADDFAQEYDAYDAAIAAFIREHGSELVEVTWPEHVVTPRCNHDANYRMI